MNHRLKVLGLAAALLLGMNMSAVQAQAAPQPAAPIEHGQKALAKKAVKKKAAVKKHKKWAKKGAKKGAKKPVAKAQHQVKARSAKAKLH